MFGLFYVVRVTGFEPATSWSQKANLLYFAWEMLFLTRFLRFFGCFLTDISDNSVHYIAGTGQNCGQNWSALSVQVK